MRIISPTSGVMFMKTTLRSRRPRFSSWQNEREAKEIPRRSLSLPSHCYGSGPLFRRVCNFFSSVFQSTIRCSLCLYVFLVALWLKAMSYVLRRIATLFSAWWLTSSSCGMLRRCVFLPLALGALFHRRGFRAPRVLVSI
jgi:hypothetical protein